jgi:hypothetical protein
LKLPNWFFIKIGFRIRHFWYYFFHFDGNTGSIVLLGISFKKCGEFERILNEWCASVCIFNFDFEISIRGYPKISNFSIETQRAKCKRFEWYKTIKLKGLKHIISKYKGLIEIISPTVPRKYWKDALALGATWLPKSYVKRHSL